MEQALLALADNIGGIYRRPSDGSDVTPFAAKAERNFIVTTLTDGQSWGHDPLLKDAICSYAYRSFDRKAVIALGEQLDTQTSSFFFVETPTAVLAQPEADAAVVATLEPDLLYGLDYETDAARKWIAVHLPAGGSGFLNFADNLLSKPYATGICFSKGANGDWAMSAQTATNQ